METFSAILAICAGNSLVTGEFPAQRPVTWSFDVFFDLRLNKRLSKQLWGWWFEIPLWRHCNGCSIMIPFGSSVDVIFGNKKCLSTIYRIKYVQACILGVIPSVRLTIAWCHFSIYCSFHSIWLRQNCQCAQCKQAHSGQRLQDPVNLLPKYTATQGNLQGEPNWTISQIPQCTCPISYNAPFRTEMCTFRFWMVHCGIWNRCIMGFAN